MSNRTLRINELIQRELSDILRQRYQAEAVTLTLTEVRTAPDLRDARIFVSVVGTEAFAEEKMAWLRRISGSLRAELGRRIILKYLPRLEYVLDRSTARGLRVLQVLDELGPEKKTDG
ncbi:MAG TPA: 30S ribosome-binding factor RbfA [Opitutaceae bacterium]|nr:30S ribosome-binding factor RbfA [Opitutaceae bacterium]